jgi:hypothetical protein
MRAGPLLPIFLCTAMGTAALATTYRWVDANGVVHYSDTPGPGAKKIDLPPAQTYRAPPAPKVTTPPAANQPASAYQSCVIAQPAADATLFEQEAVTVTANLSPSLRPGDSVTLNFDGMTVMPNAPSSLAFQISPIDRGAHTVSVTVRDGDNKVVCTSTPVTFYVRQPSVLAPQSPLRPK